MSLGDLKAPFPWFGGKSRAAHLVWPRFGNVPNYVEPFFGSGAVLLARDVAPHLETVNDADCYLANFWRALVSNPEVLATHADWPINEADLHARHQWLMNQSEFRERMKTDPEYFDVKVAGWWVWGLSQWIGSGWCSPSERTQKPSPPPSRQVPMLSGRMGIHANPTTPAGQWGGGRGIHRREDSQSSDTTTPEGD